MIRKYLVLVIMLIMSSCEPNQDLDTSSLRLYGDALEDIGYSIARTDDGYVIGGQLTEVARIGSFIDVENSSLKMGIIRTDASGKLLWKKSFGGDRPAVGTKVITLNDGSFLSAGYIIDTITKQKDIFIVKVSADGSSYIQKDYPVAGNQFGIDIIQTQDGFIVLGSTDNARSGIADSLGNISGKRDIYLLRINNNLEPVGAPKAFGFPGNDAAVAIRNDADGGFIIAGTTDNNWPRQALNNIFILKTNSLGEPTQIRIIGTTDDEYASDVEILDDGYLIAGVVGAEGTEQSVYITKIPLNIFSPALFTRKFKVTSASSTATSFAVRAINRYGDNGFVMAGQAGTGASAKMLVFITDAEGVQLQGKELITTATGVQIAYDVVTDDNDDIVVVGKNSFENNSMISLFKIRL